MLALPVPSKGVWDAEEEEGLLSAQVWLELCPATFPALLRAGRCLVRGFIASFARAL